MKRTQIRKGGRWAHNKTKRVAVVLWIVYPHFIEYKYERPVRQHNPWDFPDGTVPYARRTRVRYRSFILGFSRAKEAR